VPRICCPTCGNGREVVEYLARLPLRCTRCGRGLVRESDAVIPLVAVPAANGQPDSEALPSLAYVALSSADISDLLEPSTPSPANEFAPSQTEISILPDPELAPLVVSEKFSASTILLPPPGSGSVSSEESEKSKLAERLKEITTIASPAPPPTPIPLTVPTNEREAPLRRLWHRLTRR
jgi:hypothetical protein